MTITAQLTESNGAGETITNPITTGHYGTTDAANKAAATTEPITAGNNSFEKWQRLKWESGTGSFIQDVRVWRSAGTPGANNSHLTNLTTTPPFADDSYATPTDSDSTVATLAMPTSDPGSENVDSTGLTSSGTYSGYVVKQVQTTGAATEGNTGGQETWQWEEVA